MKLNPRRLALLLVIVAMVAGCIAIILAVAVPRTPPNTAVVRRGDISAEVDATGTVQSKRSARLSLPSSGLVADIAKREGDDVAQGDVILALRADDAMRRVRQAELTVQSRQLDLQRAKAAPSSDDIDIAQANLTKATVEVAAAEAAYEESPTAQNSAARESAQADLEIARANFDRVVSGPTRYDLGSLENAVTSAQIDLQSAQAALEQTKLTAPFTSTVTEIDVHVGELVGAFTQLAAVADVKSLEIAAQVDEIDVANVQVGQNVIVRFDAFPGKTFAGRLTRLFPAASTQRGSTSYGALVDFNAAGTNVRPGMGASLKIETIQKSGVLLVPNGAIKSVGTRKAVHVVSPGPPRDVIVETGVTNGEETEIVSGLNEGDVVSLQP